MAIPRRTPLPRRTFTDGQPDRYKPCLRPRSTRAPQRPSRPAPGNRTAERSQGKNGFSFCMRSLLTPWEVGRDVDCEGGAVSRRLRITSSWGPLPPRSPVTTPGDRYVVGRETCTAGREALGAVLLRRPRHAPRRRAHLLRADVAVPTLLLAVSLLGLLGEYPATYNAIIGHLAASFPLPRWLRWTRRCGRR